MCLDMVLSKIIRKLPNGLKKVPTKGMLLHNSI